MSKWDKLLARIKTLSNDIRFEELKKILESYGYKMHSPKKGSSHFIFRKQGCVSITIPKQKPIKKVYIELVREIVEQEEKDEKN